MKDYKVSECGHIPCPEKNTPELEVILYKIIEADKSPTPTIGPNGRTQKDQILKTDLLIVQKNGVLKLDIDNNFDWMAIVAKEIKFQADNDQSEFKVVWEDFDWYKLLKGKDGADGESAVKPGRNGKSGKSGKPGGTRNSPDIYLFVGEMTVENGSIDNIDISFDLNGFPGGKGGNGGNGGNGEDGKDGKDARNDGPFCGNNAGNGQDGGHAGYGGRGGNGGCGGDGPIINIFCLRPEDFQKFSYASYQVEGGKNGYENFGVHGKAGTPGKGGSRGSYAGNCDGRRRNGNDGQPKSSNAHRWHLGNGNAGFDGKDGDFLIDTLANDTVFN